MQDMLVWVKMGFLALVLSPQYPHGAETLLSVQAGWWDGYRGGSRSPLLISHILAITFHQRIKR